MQATIVLLAGIVSGITLGTLSGFGISAHQAILSGSVPAPKNRLLAMFCKPSSQLRSTETLVVFLFVIASLPISFSLLAAPVIVSSFLNYQNGSVLIWAIAIEVVATFAFRWLGASLWLRIS